MRHEGIYCCLLAIAPEYAALPLQRPIHFAFTYDEEVGCLGAKRLTEVLAKRPQLPQMAIIGEPTEMRAIDGHKGWYGYSVHIKGLAGHGSDPDRGVNATEIAALYVNRLLDLRHSLMARKPKACQFDPPYSTLSIGRIEGGVAPNVIAESCVVEWEMRPVQESDLIFLKEAMATFCRADAPSKNAGNIV